MIYQVFSKYYQLTTQGKVPELLCKSGFLHAGLVPNMDENDKIYLYCLECDYIKYPGLNLYNSLKEVIENHPDGTADDQL